MKEKSQEKKNAILKATLELIAEQGFHGTSISQIADRANVNVGSIYYHFDNKDDILNALYIECKTRITQSTLRDCSDDIPADKCIKRMMINNIHYFIENREQLSFIEQYENSPYFANIVLTSEYAEIKKAYEDMYNRYKMQDLIKDLSSEILQRLLFGSIISLIKYCINNANALEEPTLSVAIEAIWDMIRK